MSQRTSEYGDYVAKIIKSRGLTYGEVAERAGETDDYVRQVVAGRVKLPDPERRRKLAKALRVTSLDLLMAAGQLNDRDLEEAEQAGVLRTTTPDDVAELTRTLRQIRMTPERAYVIRHYLERYVDWDEETAAAEATSTRSP